MNPCSCPAFRYSFINYCSSNSYIVLSQQRFTTVGFEKRFPDWVHSDRESYFDFSKFWIHSSGSNSASLKFTSSIRRFITYPCFVSSRCSWESDYRRLIKKSGLEPPPFLNTWLWKDVQEDHRKTHHNQHRLHAWPWLLSHQALHQMDNSFCQNIYGSASMLKAQLVATRYLVGDCSSGSTRKVS